MGKLFGTDGIRGIANQELDTLLAMKTGQAAAQVLTREFSHRAKILIGKDTRISSDMLEAALCAGICSAGADVVLLGVIPTPAVAFLTVQNKADAGIVISASHNSFEHNGIKIFNQNGYKLSDALEGEIEDLILHPEKMEKKTGDQIGRILHMDHAGECYVDHLKKSIEGDLEGLHVAVDCGNGAASLTSRMLFDRLGLKADMLSVSPDGININKNCGSTKLDALRRAVKSGNYDAGIAFDGDADRCLIVDERGEVLDGDRIMAICATELKKTNRLPHNTFVATVLSNLGLHAYAKENGMCITTSNVGDRYVLEKMLEGGLALGGEQSGHIIFSEFATTGDGELTAIQFLSILKKLDKKASELAGMISQYPQVMINVNVPNHLKKKTAEISEVKAAIEAREAEFGGKGRILVRPSGTEALVRVMVEGEQKETVEKCAREIADVIESAVLELK